jgi:hypothetical protein
VVNEDPAAEISTGSSIISLAHGVQEVALTKRHSLFDSAQLRGHYTYTAAVTISRRFAKMRVMWLMWFSEQAAAVPQMNPTDRRQ